MKKVSIIIPLYNEEKYIKSCLESIFKQSLKPDEVIVIDDGSSDDSIGIVRKVKGQRSNVKLLRQKHAGPAKARNLGANKARGDILVFLDADMYFDKRYLEKLTKPIRDGDAVATFTRQEYLANKDNVLARCWNINSNLPENLHIDPKIGDYATTFRAILARVFYKLGGFKSHGYTDDVTVFKKSKSKAAAGAICYHFNPSSLSEVFVSARWMGRDKGNRGNMKSFLVFSPPWSLVRATLMSIKNRNPYSFPFKLTFDVGYFLGIIDANLSGVHFK